MALLHVRACPPGKTTTIVRFLVMLKRNFGLKVPILACAQSNVSCNTVQEISACSSALLLSVMVQLHCQTPPLTNCGML